MTPFLNKQKDAMMIKCSRIALDHSFASRTQILCRTIFGRFHRTSSALPGLGTCPSTLSYVLIAHGARQLVILLRRSMFHDFELSSSLSL